MESSTDAVRREPWNKGKIVGQKAPFKPKDIWALRVRLQMENRVRELALWAAAGSVDTDLSFLSFLELYGTEIAERRMPARRVVEALDVVEHI